MDYLSHNVSENLKKIRKAKGMSLEFETDQTHVSASEIQHFSLCVVLISPTWRYTQDERRPPHGSNQDRSVSQSAP